MPVVMLWQAVALSVNRNPVTLDWNRAGEIFDKRMSVALSNVDAGNLTLIAHYPRNRPVSEVGLVPFATWARDLTLDIPQELLALAVRAVVAPAPPLQMQPAQVDAGTADDGLNDEYRAAFRETVYNGRPINWRYWVHQIPMLTACEASRLLSGLDPDIFENLEFRPNANDPSAACARARMIQRLAQREGLNDASPSDWLQWANRKTIAVHVGYRSAMRSDDGTEPKHVPAGNGAIAKPNWRNAIRGEAFEEWVRTIASGGTATLRDVAEHCSSWCKEKGVKSDIGRFPTSGYIKTHVIGGTHWQPPRGLSREAAKEHLEQKAQEEQAKDVM